MNFERKFIVDSAGSAEEKKLNEDEKARLNKPPKKSSDKYATLEHNRTFSVGLEGKTEVQGDNNLKLKIKKKF